MRTTRLTSALAICALSTPVLAQDEAATIEVQGVKVLKKHEDDAKRGIFMVNGERLSRREALALQDEMVRHPVTGQLIPAADAEKAKTLFPTHDGRWLDEKAADSYHQRSGRPWAFRTKYGTVLAPLPLELIKTKIAPAVDAAVTRLLPITGSEPPHPDHRPAVLVAPGTDAYVKFGDAVGGAESAYGCFLPEAPMTVSGAEHAVRPVIANWIDNWGEFYIRHAAAMAWVNAYSIPRGGDLPNWFLRGAGGLASLMQSDYYTGYFGGLAVGRGGVPDLANHLPGLTLHGDMAPSQMNDEVLMAGLALEFGMRGGDADATAALQQVTAAFKDPEAKLQEPLKAYCKALTGKRDAIAAYLQKTIDKQQNR